jgi:hypothetical protein
MPFYANVFEGIDKISDTVEDVQAPLLKRFSQMKTPINKTPEQGSNFSSFLVFSSSLIINTDQRSISLGDVPISIRRLRIFLILGVNNSSNANKTSMPNNYASTRQRSVKFIKSQYAVPSIALVKNLCRWRAFG